MVSLHPWKIRLGQKIFTFLDATCQSSEQTPKTRRDLEVRRRESSVFAFVAFFAFFRISFENLFILLPAEF